MRPPQRKRRLQFEVMESREVLSASLAGAHWLPPPWSSPSPRSRRFRCRRCTGCSAAAIRRHTLPDVGTTYDLFGQGLVQPLGPMTVTGSVHFPGSILKGHGGGTLTLSDSQGTLTLQLTEPVLDPLPGPLQPITQRGFPPLTHLFGFEITGGTGAFENATGRGTASLQLVADPIGNVPAATQNLLEQTGHFDLDLVGSYSLQPPGEGDLAVSLTTDHSLYQRGQPVVITLTETNISSHDLTVLGPIIDGRFSITHNGAPVWISNKGPLPLFLSPRRSSNPASRSRCRRSGTEGRTWGRPRSRQGCSWSTVH